MVDHRIDPVFNIDDNVPFCDTCSGPIFLDDEAHWKHRRRPDPRKPDPSLLEVEVIDLRHDIARYRDGISRIATGDYDRGYSLKEYAEAILAGDEPKERDA